MVSGQFQADGYFQGPRFSGRIFSKMIVNHFNTFPYGGAATAALRLHVELTSQGVDSRFLYSTSEREIPKAPNVHQIHWKPASTHSNFLAHNIEKRRVRQLHRLYDRHLAKRDAGLEVFSMPSLTDKTVPINSTDVSGIVHLHWIAFLADYPSFFAAIPEGVPIVWTLHDMNPLTGGCHYSGGCGQFVDGCGDCPQIVNPGPEDVSRVGFQVKRKTLRRHNLTIVSPSVWLKRLAETSSVFPPSTTFHHIRLGFDLKKLHPIPKQQARQRLGIESSATLIGFGAESIDNRRKGLDLLLPALAELKQQSPIECLVFGAGEIEAAGLDLPKMHSFGFLSDPRKIALFYSACDFVVVPSREDNQPQVGLEAMACGTPVVAFDVGGISEYVRPGITGWLAQPESPSDLVVQMRKMIVDDDSRANLSSRCRHLMEREFNIISQAGKYRELYNRLSASQRRSAA